jgi:hypothetical protein
MATRIATVEFEGIAPYSQSRMHDTPKLEKERPDDYEARTWREKSSYAQDGTIVIPAMAFKQALDTVARRLGEQIPGKGKATYTKHFTGGVMCAEDIRLEGWTKDTVQPITINANSDGVRGSGKRVKRTFPQIPAGWKGTAEFIVLDAIVTNEVFERHINEAGRFTGIGRFRPENGGLNGRFIIKSIKWSEA